MTITIPPDALEKATDAVHEFFHNTHSRRFSRELARAACLALINNWPGVHVHEWQRPWLGGMSGTDIILPLTENSNERE